MTIRPHRSFRSRAARASIAVALSCVAACGGGSPARYGGPGYGAQGQPGGNGAWSHRSSQGGGDVSVGGDGSGFYYYIDSSGSSWSGG